MSRALLALALGLALGGPPFQWASSLVEVLLSGSQPNPEYGSSWDPNGGQEDPEYSSHFDPNG
jgi:hypothetical protein